MLYAQAKGGRLLNDFRRLEALNPYASPAGQLDATYEQLNAAVGVRVGTLSGFSLHIFGGYQSLEDDTYFALVPWGTIPEALSLGVWDTDNIYAGAELGYSYRDIVTFSARGTYRDWSAKDGGDLMGVLAFKPAFEGDFKVELHPITPLRVEVGYRHVSRAEIQGEHADPVCNLYAGATYDLFRGVGVYARLDNLLDKDCRYDWYYPTQGINFWGGVMFRF